MAGSVSAEVKEVWRLNLRSDPDGGKRQITSIPHRSASPAGTADYDWTTASVLDDSACDPTERCTEYIQYVVER